MSKIDPQVLYLILTKVAAKETVYGFDFPGTLTPRQLGEVYDRITGGRTGPRQNWTPHLQQLNDLLARCSLPALAAVVVATEGTAPPSPPAALAQVHAAKWPPFHELKNLYRKPS